MANQLRSNLRFSLVHKIRSFWNRRKLGFLGQRVFIEKNVDFMRFPINIKVFDDVIVKEGVKVCSCNTQAKITIGKNTTVGYHTFIFSSKQVTIGENCLIAPFVYIVDSDHGIDKAMLINNQPNQTAPIVIKDDVWIGTGAKILKGVTIGQGAVVASGALVKSDVEPYSIVGGVPAKVIGERE